ncbi:hypothetical protein PS2_044847 [Malus domestica]
MEKRHKIQVFQRELPLCLELVIQQPERKDSGSDLTKLLSDCIAAFKDNAQYRDDIRFLKIWFLYMDTSEDFESFFWKCCTGRFVLADHGLLHQNKLES